MDISFFSKKILSALKNLDLDKLYHVRLRIGYGISILYDSCKVYLSENGITLFEKDAIICSENDIKEIIENVTEHSIYAFNESIKQGFITTSKGIRIGLSGECVFDNGKILTIKNFNGLSIRVPHKIIGSSEEIFKYIIQEKTIHSALIISPPGFGKTTILKDIAEKLNTLYKFSILIIDERNEFNDVSGVNIDKIIFSDKLYSLKYGIRSLAPEIIITDELDGVDDWLAVKTAVNSGVKIIASCHGKYVDDLINKDYFVDGIFERYIFLEGEGSPGRINSVFNREFKAL